MKFNVVVLAQGQQSRLPGIDRAKQLLPLPACGGVTILQRTLIQLALMKLEECSVKVIADERIARHPSWTAPPQRLAEALYRPDFDVTIETLKDPGNSSLKGLARYCAGPVHQARK